MPVYFISKSISRVGLYDGAHVMVEGQADAEIGHALGEAGDFAAIGRPLVRRQLRADGDRLPDCAKPSARRIGVDDVARAQRLQQSQVRQDGGEFVVDVSLENAPVVPPGHEFEAVRFQDGAQSVRLPRKLAADFGALVASESGFRQALLQRRIPPNSGTSSLVQVIGLMPILQLIVSFRE